MSDIRALVAIVDAVIGVEGRYSNHPADRGGETMWGITAVVARANGYKGAMVAMPRDIAVDIYLRQYVYAPGFVDIHMIAPAIAEELVEAGVNLGPAVPALWLQMALNAFNDGGRDYPDLREDHDVGPATRGALKAFLLRRGAEGVRVMVAALNALQGARYIELSRLRGANEAFVYGWIRARVPLGKPA